MVVVLYIAPRNGPTSTAPPFTEVFCRKVLASMLLTLAPMN